MIIYLIENKVNGKKYVGQHCGRKDARWKQHLNEALKKQNPKPLYASIRKYGTNNFTYKVLEELDRTATQQLLDEREIYFIKEYDTYIKNGKGYNLTLGGGGNMVTYCATDRGEKTSESLDRTDFAAYDPETGELYDVYDKLDKNLNSSAIYRAAKYGQNSNENGIYQIVDGYIWLMGPENHRFPEKIDIKKTIQTKIRKPKEYSTEIAKYALSGLLVHIYDEPPMNVAKQLNISYPSLLKALRGDQRVVSGYFWRRFPKGTSPDQIEDKLENHVIKLSKRQITSFPIFKYVNNKEVMRYPSVMDAILDNNLAPTQILNSLELGKPDKNGFEWKWVKRPSHIRHSVSEGLLGILSSVIHSSY